jgi:two-component system, NarL family, response regulator DevR
MKTAITNSPVKVAIVEDTPRFSKGLVNALRAAPQLQSVGVCETVAEALSQLPAWRPDVVLLDLDLGTGRDGIDILPELVRQLPETRFLVLTVVDDPEAIFQAFICGAAGYLRKSISLEELPVAILAVHQGYPRLSPEVLRRIIETLKNGPSEEELAKLTPRETQFLDLLAQGYEPKELATRFNLSPETIKRHTKNIREKLGVSTTPEAVQKVYPSKLLRILARWISGGKALC